MVTDEQIEVPLDVKSMLVAPTPTPLTVAVIFEPAGEPVDGNILESLGVVVKPGAKTEYPAGVPIGKYN